MLTWYGWYCTKTFHSRVDSSFEALISKVYSIKNVIKYIPLNFVCDM